MFCYEFQLSTFNEIPNSVVKLIFIYCIAFLCSPRNVTVNPLMFDCNVILLRFANTPFCHQANTVFLHENCVRMN